MTENTENTLSAYLGHEFQQHLMWQLLIEPEFAEKILPDLAIEYFDDPNLKRLFIIMLEYYKEFDKVPNFQNQSIHLAINKYKTPNNTIEEESLFAVIRRIEQWNERVINKQMLYDGDVIQKSATAFIKQQEYRKLGESIQEKVKNGEIKSKYTIAAIEDRFLKIQHIGEEDDDCDDISEGIAKALRKEFRETIPTGIGAIDVLTGGGLGKGEIGVILAPSGVGKTTALTIIANTAYLDDKNVAHVIFEDTKDQIKRKHYVIWAESALSRLEDEDENKRVFDNAVEVTSKMEGRGRLLVKRFSQEDTTIKDIKNWMLNYQKKFGFKFDILVLDYLDCLESHKKSPDRNEAELAIVKGFEALAADFNIPAWTAIQTNRSGIGAEFVEAQQTGGNIKRMQKAHFFMSIAKTQAQQEANFANIRIIKARFAKDGQMFEDCIFNNDTMKIIIDDPRYRYIKTYKNFKHYDEQDLEKIEKKAEGMAKVHAALSQKVEEGPTIGSTQNINDLLEKNKMPEEDNPIDKLKELGVETIHIDTARTDLSDEEKTGLLNFVKDVIEEENEKEINEGVTEGVNTGKNDDLLELDDTEDIEILKNDAVSDGVNDAVSDGVNDGVNTGTDIINCWTGETITEATVQEEVKIENIPPPLVKKKEIDLSQFKSPGVFVQEHDSTQNEPVLTENEPKFEGDDMNKIWEEIQKIDPDAPQGQYKSVYEIIRKRGDSQQVIKKE